MAISVISHHDLVLFWNSDKQRVMCIFQGMPGLWLFLQQHMEQMALERAAR